MKPELYNDLKKYAYSSFEYAHVGLYTLLKSDKNFANHMERKYRLKQYEQSGDFYMTANERWFHLIGFIDAIVSFQRGNLFKNPETLKQELTETYFGDGEPLNEEDLSDYQDGLVGIDEEMGLLGHCYLCFECGEEWAE